MPRASGLLVIALAALWACGCGQRPRLHVVPSLDAGSRVVFDMPRTDVNGLLEFRVEDEAGKALWHVHMSYEKGHRITYGVLPTGGNMTARQEVPTDGSAPPDIRGRRVQVRVTYQYDEFAAASAGHFEKTVDVP
jgi:hypothetical protein